MAGRTGEIVAETNPDGTLKIMEKANDLGRTGAALESIAKGVGLVGGLIDACSAPYCRQS